MGTYRLPSLGLSVSYPVKWKVEEKPDKDTLVKVSGTVQESLSGIMTVSTNQRNDLSLATFCKMLEEGHLSKQPGYQKLSEYLMNFGRDHKFVGINRLISLDMGGTKVRQRWVVFPYGADFVCIVFTSTAEQYDKIAPLYNDMLVRLAPPEVTSTATRSPYQAHAAGADTAVATGSGINAGTSAGQFIGVKANGTPVSFSYPQNWQVEEPGEGGHLLKISNKPADGRASEISLYCSDMPPNVTADFMLSKLEEKVYEGKKNYRLVNRQPANFGSGTTVDGVEQEISFEHNGSPFRQRLVSFVVKDKFYLLSLVSNRTNDVDDRMLFSRIKASIS